MFKVSKLLTIIFIAVLLSNCSQEKVGNVPISGEPYTITYTPTMLQGEIKLVYVFDYWGTLYSSYAGPDKLFENVMNADPGRTTTVNMVKTGTDYTATINIPAGVTLLSYYFTDGENYDYNDKKTYVSYIYNKQGIPVKNARFRNVDFLEMAGASPQRIIEEIKSEITDYPKNWVSHIVYWRKIFENAETIDELKQELENANTAHDKLVQTYGETDSLKQVKAAYLFDFSRNIYRPVQILAVNSYEEFKRIMASIPVENQYGSMKENYAKFLKADRRRYENKIFMAELKGNIAPDFEFITVTGKTGKLSDFRRHYTLLEFWSTSCGPCIAEIENLNKAYNKYNGKGFEILSVCCDNTPKDNFIKFTSEKGILWQQVLEGNNKTISDLYKVYYFPTFILIDPNGKVINLDSEIRGERLVARLDELYQNSL